MRKIITLLMIVFLLFSLPACGKVTGSGSEFQQNASQSDDAGDSDSESDGDSGPADDDSDNSGGSGGSVSSSGKWPKELDFIPEFTYGKIVNVISMTDSYDGIDYADYQIMFENAGKDAAEKYGADLEKAGFDMPYDPIEVDDELSSYTEYSYEQYAFETDDTLYYISVDYWVDGNDAGAIYISIPSDSGTGGSQSQSGDGDNGTEVHVGDGDSEFNWGTLSGSDIPDGYPMDDVPLIGLDGGQLIGSSGQDMDDMGTIYIVVFGVNQDIETIAQAISGQLEEHVTSRGGTFDSIMDMMFMGNVNGCEYAVTVGDGSSDGFTTIVSYTVTCME